MTWGLLTKDFDPERWADQFANQRQRIKIAQTSWQDLVSEGCDPDVLNLGFSLACAFSGSPGYVLVSTVHSKAREYLRDAKELRKHLRASRDAARKVAASVDKLDLAKVIDSALLELEENIKNTTGFSSLRNFNSNVLLAGLCGYVEYATGCHHYREISVLLERAYAAYGKDRLIGPGEEAIRKTLDRFQKKNPDWFTADGKFHYERLKAELRGVALLLALFHIVLGKLQYSTPVQSPTLPALHGADGKLTNSADFASGRKQ